MASTNDDIMCNYEKETGEALRDWSCWRELRVLEVFVDDCEKRVVGALCRGGRKRVKETR